MADAKTTALTAATQWASGDLLYMVSDPGGTPASRKITLDNVFSKIVSAANSKAIGVTGYSLTGSDTTSLIDLAGTWNTTGHATLIKANVTNTASGANSLLMDLQVGGTSYFKVKKTGVVDIEDGAGGTMRIDPASGFSILISGTKTWDVTQNAIWVHSGSQLGFSNSGSNLNTIDLRLFRDASGVLAQRNSTSAQTSRVYGTYTDASNYRRVSLAMTTGGVATLLPEGAGTGASGNVLHISGLPTSNPGPGILWNNAGTPAIGT